MFSQACFHHRAWPRKNENAGFLTLSSGTAVPQELLCCQGELGLTNSWDSYFSSLLLCQDLHDLTPLRPLGGSFGVVFRLCDAFETHCYT